MAVPATKQAPIGVVLLGDGLLGVLALDAMPLATEDAMPYVDAAIIVRSYAAPATLAPVSPAIACPISYAPACSKWSSDIVGFCVTKS